MRWLFWPPLLLFRRHHHHHLALCLLCVSYLLHARFCFFSVHLSPVYIHFTSQLYIQHTQKDHSQYQTHNGIFRENWTQTTIRFVIFKQQREKKKLKIIWLPLNQKKGSNSIVVSRWRIIIISIVIIFRIRKISFNSHWIQCVYRINRAYIRIMYGVFWLQWVQNSGFNCSQLSTIVLVFGCMCVYWLCSGKRSEFSQNAN